LHKLERENLIEEYKRIAESVKLRILSMKGVCGIVYGGGLVRGFADRYSDVDIIVFLSNRKRELRERIKKIGVDEQKSSKIDIDLEIHYIEDFAKRKMDEISKWNYSKSKIVFDPDGRINELLRKKLSAPKEYWIERIVICAEYMSWYCCPQREGTATLVDAWIGRGDLISAHYCINYAIDLLLEIIYALNKEFLPAPKWRIFCSYSLNWLPRDYRKLLEDAMKVEGSSLTDLDRRLGAMRLMWRDVASRIENDAGLTPDSITREFVKKVVHQT
jgi:predicted nucleotidyltransferase